MIKIYWKMKQNAFEYMLLSTEDSFLSKKKMHLIISQFINNTYCIPRHNIKQHQVHHSNIKYIDTHTPSHTHPPHTPPHTPHTQCTKNKLGNFIIKPFRILYQPQYHVQKRYVFEFHKEVWLLCTRCYLNLLQRV